MREEKNKAYWILSILVILAIFSRLLPHPPNFTPVGGAALFAGAFMMRRYLAFIIPIMAIFVTDLILNNLIFGDFYTGFVWFTKGAIWIYLSYIIILFIGTSLFKKITITRILGGGLISATIFFILSNIGVWLSSGMYPITFTGLTSTFVAAIPFFWNTLAGDLFYTTVMFGSFYMINRYYPISVVLEKVRA